MGVKLRICASLLFNEGVLFRTRRFVPDYRYTSSFVGVGAADELMLLDITRRRTAEGRELFWRRVREIGDEAMTPTMVGGWIEGMEEVDLAIRDHGADGVVVGRGASERLIGEIAHRYGSQACTVALDCLPGGAVRARGEGESGAHVVQRAVEAERWGAGQVLLTSIDRDGSLEGYDLGLLGEVVASVSVPVVIAGGCGNWGHMQEAFAAGASACATSNIFQINESGMRSARRWLVERGVNVRPAA